MGGESGDSRSSDKLTNAEIAAAIKLQAFTRGVMSRIKVAGMLGSVIEGMLEEQAPTDSGDDGTYDGSENYQGDDNMSLASDDFNSNELQQYLERKYATAPVDSMASDDEVERIVRPSARKESWIVHSPLQAKAKLGSFSANDVPREQRFSTVKERASIFVSSKSPETRDYNATSASDLNYMHSTPPSQDKPKVQKIGETVTKLLSPKRNLDLTSPTSRLKAATSSVRRNSSAIVGKVSDYTSSLSPKLAKSNFKPPRRTSDAFMDKVTVFKDFGEKMKTAKDAMAIKPNIMKKKKANYDIDTQSTPRAREIRKSIEAGLFSKNMELPKIQPLDEPEIEGIKAKIAQLGFDKAPADPAAEVVNKEQRKVDVAARRYHLHNSATKIQAVARGFLYRKKDQEAMLRVQRWLQQNQNIERALTGDPTEVSEEERAKAVEEFAKTIERLVPPELTRGASRAAGMGASFVARKLSVREQSRRDMGVEHPYKAASISNLKNAFESTQQEAISETTNKKSSFRSRQEQINAAAITIQAVGRGYLVRKSDFGAAVSALNWLKEYKLLDELAETKKRISHDQSKLEGALGAISKLQSKLRGCAIKIQAIGRGYIVRKFDMKTMMSVMEWVRACKLEIEEEQAPKTEELEDTWIFLENANQWIRESEKRKLQQVDAAVDEKIPVEELDVNDLLATWEFLKRDKPSESSKKSKEDPTDDELKRLQNWLTESDYPYISSSDDDMHQLWAFLGSAGVNVDVFCGDDWDESQRSDIRIQYIDEDFSRFYGKVPSIKALIEFWSFGRKHDIESLAVTHQEPDEEPKDDKKHLQQPTESTPVETEKESEPEKIAVEAEQESEREKVESKPVDTEARTAADTASDSEGSTDPQKLPVKKAKKRTGTNIDGMMSSLKWLKKRGLDLNRIKGGASIGKPASIAVSGNLAWLQLAQTKGASSARIPDAGPKMSSALNWLEQKGLDICENISKQLAADPTPEEMTEVVKRMENKNTGGKKILKVPTAEEMKQTMNWWKIQESTKNLKKKKKKKTGKRKMAETRNEKDEAEEDVALEPPALASTDSMQYALNFLQKTGKASGATNSNIGLEKTFELMKQQVGIKRESEISASLEKQPSVTDPSPNKTKEPSDSNFYETDALEWLRTGAADMQVAAYFQKLDKTLPGKETQTNEQRAKKIAKAMKWSDKQGFLDAEEVAEKIDAISEGDESISVSDVDDDEPPKPIAPPKAVQKKVEAKVSKKAEEEAPKTPKSSKESRSSSKTKFSKKKESKLLSKSPRRKKTRSRSSSRSRSVSRSPSPTPTAMKKEKSKDGKSSKNAALPSVKSMLSPRKNKKTLMEMKTGEQDPERDFELAVLWLTSRDETMEDAKYFKKLDGMVPQNADHSLDDRARELVKALNWVRRTSEKNKSNDPEDTPKPEKTTTKTMKSPRPQSSKRKIKLRKEDDSEKTDRAVMNLKDLVKVQKTRKAETDGAKKSESTPEQDFENALNFMRIKEEGGDVMECEDANYFKKLDNMLPKKGTPEERAKEMVKMIGWLRKKGKA